MSVYVLVLGEGTSEFIYTAAVNGRLHHAPRRLPMSANPLGHTLRTFNPRDTPFIRYLHNLSDLNNTMISGYIRC